MTAEATTLNRQTPAIGISRETLLYALIFGVAISLRLPALGAAPLDDGEARMALAAWRWLSAGQAPDPALISNPLVFAGMVVSFALAGAGNAAARFLPALGGILLPLLPLRFRDTFGRVTPLVASALLALSPALIAASRRATGANLALLFLLLALDALRRYRADQKLSALALAGVWLALGLLSDFGALLVALALFLGAAAALFDRDDPQPILPALSAALDGIKWPVFVGALAGTLFLVTTLMGAYPRGLGAAANLLSALAQGFTRRPPDAPLVGALLPLYEPLVLIFGLVGLARGFDARHPTARFLSGWGLAAILFAFVYAGGLPSQLSYAAAPLAMLAAVALEDLFTQPLDGPAWAVWMLGVILLGTAIFAFMQWGFFVSYPEPLTIPTLNLELTPLTSFLLPMVMLLVVTLILYSAGVSLWGFDLTLRGLATGIILTGLLVALNSGFGLAYLRASDPREPWNISPAQPALDMLGRTAREISDISSGMDDEASITVQGDPDGPVAWVLRDFENTTFVEQASPQVTSDIVIAPAEANVALGERYVGQDFVVARTWQPRGLDAQRWLRWWLFREVSTLDGTTSRVVLWVREDIYMLLQN